MTQNLKPPLKAIILAAGYGKRLGDITKKYPKPLVTINGKTLLQHALETLDNVPCSHIVINLHYMPEKIESHLKNLTHINAQISLSHEKHTLLDTGGGIRKALPLLENNDKPFIILNSDCLWSEKEKTIPKLIRTWNPETMDCLMLLAQKNKARGYDGNGNFNINQNGQLSIPNNTQNPDYIYTGLCLASPNLFKPQIMPENPNTPFPMRILWNHAVKKKRLCGLIHEHLWMHVGTPEGIQNAEAIGKKSMQEQ